MIRVAFMFVLLCVVGCRSTRRAEPPSGAHFGILSYNVNWGGPGSDQAIEIIRRSGADIVYLQDTTPQWESQIRNKLAHEYPFAEFRTSKNRIGGGLSFLSKIPGTEVAYIPSDTGWFDGWIVEFQTRLGPIQVVNVHLRPPVSDRGSWVSGYFNTRDDRVAELDRFLASTHDRAPIVIAGDFNDGESSAALGFLESRGMINACPNLIAAPKPGNGVTAA